MTCIFEIIGYSKDFYLDGKFLGYVHLEEKDRDVLGYHGRIVETLDKDLKIGRRKLKAGTRVTTELNMSNGKVLPEFEYLIRPKRNE